MKLTYQYSQKLIAIQCLFTAYFNFLVYWYIVAPLVKNHQLHQPSQLYKIWLLHLATHEKDEESIIKFCCSILQILKTMREPSQGGVSLIFSQISRLGPFFWVQKSEFQYFLGFSEKVIFFWGMKILWIFFGGHHKIGLV